MNLSDIAILKVLIITVLLAELAKKMQKSDLTVKSGAL